MKVHMQNVNLILIESMLAKLIQLENFIGWVYDYQIARVMTNDFTKYRVLGIPHNSCLAVASINPNEMSHVPEEKQEIILLCVLVATKLPQDDDLMRTKIDHFKDQKSSIGTPDRQIDEITQNELQFGGLECRVLGTFFMDRDGLWLGSDFESFAMVICLSVYRLYRKALKKIVNYLDPIYHYAAHALVEQLRLKGEIKPYKIGKACYPFTDRIHRRDRRAEKVPVFVQPADFLARRTADLGMTRTGKSKMIKQMVSVVKRVADESHNKIGQIIYDINGEYANANQQDKGALTDIYPEDTLRYRMLETPNVEELQNNFYIQLNDGFAIIRRVVEENKNHQQNDVAVFLNASFDEPEKDNKSSYRRWQVRTAAYQSMLFMAGFSAPNSSKYQLEANLALYHQKLNFYSHIWQELRGQPLDGTAVIATDFPQAVKEALSNPDPLALETALAAWEPLAPIEYDLANKDRTLFEFGQVVDAIEDGQFAPPPIERLREAIPGAWTHERFGTRICHNCDARFSCDSYRRYARGTRQTAERSMTYFIDPDPDQEDRRTNGLRDEIQV